MAIYGYLMVTRAIDPVALERGRMCQVSTAQVPAPVEPPRRARLPHAPGAGHPHLAPQHRQAARRPGRATSSWPGWRRTRTSTTSSTATSPPPPSRPTRRAWCMATEREVKGFAMPGTGIPELRSPRRPHRPRRHLRPRHPPQPDRRAGRGEAVARRRAGRASRPEAEASRDRLLGYIERMGRIAAAAAGLARQNDRSRRRRWPAAPRGSTRIRSGGRSTPRHPFGQGRCRTRPADLLAASDSPEPSIFE